MGGIKKEVHQQMVNLFSRSEFDSRPITICTYGAKNDNANDEPKEA
jgi:hypothetical protein